MKVQNLLLACFIITGLTACEKGDSIDIAIANLSGNWVQERKWHLVDIYQEIYHFKNDQTFEISGIVLDGKSKEPLGYLLQTSGNYEIIGDSLFLKDFKIYSSWSDNYTKLEKLKYIGITKLACSKIMYNANLDSLTLRYRCPANAYCIPNPKLRRMMKQ